MRVVRSREEPRPDLLPSEADVDHAFDDARTTHAASGISAVAMTRVPSLDARAKAKVWLALEHMQVMGSFKVRGAHRAMLVQKRAGKTRVIAASAGNHGAGVAYVARALGMQALIIVPSAAPKKKRDAIEALGATLIVNDGGYDAAEARAIALAAEQGVPFVSAYDDVDIVLGNGSTLASEIHEALGPASPTAIILTPFGGGGLAAGLACGFARLHRHAPGAHRNVWGVQSEACPTFAMSLERRAAVEQFEGAPTLADGLEGGIPARAFARAAGVVAGIAVVSEESIASAMRFAFRDLGLVIEGSAAVALVPILDGATADLGSATDVVAVLTGRNVDPERLASVVGSAR